MCVHAYRVLRALRRRIRPLCHTGWSISFLRSVVRERTTFRLYNTTAILRRIAVSRWTNYEENREFDTSMSRCHNGQYTETEWSVIRYVCDVYAVSNSPCTHGVQSESFTLFFFFLSWYLPHVVSYDGRTANATLIPSATLAGKIILFLYSAARVETRNAYNFFIAQNW